MKSRVALARGRIAKLLLASAATGLLGVAGLRAADAPAPSMTMSAGHGDNGQAMSGGSMMASQGAAGPPIEGDMPELKGATTWFNSKPLTRAALKGKVVVVDFWTYSCINCLRALPYVSAWYKHYKDSGLVVIGVHSPEFGFEKDAANVKRAIAQFGITYPVALDSDMTLWNAFHNQFWPAHYFIDANGKIRGHHFGEGKYERSERTIRKLLMESGAKNLPDPLDDAAGTGVSAASDSTSVESPETYVGYARAENFASTDGFARDSVKDYRAPVSLALNQWALSGRWKAGAEMAELVVAPGRLQFRFKARDLHLVLGPNASGKPVRFRVLLDGKAPGADHGVDIDDSGAGTIKEHRLYQLIRQRGPVVEHEFSIEFLDAGAQAYSFTFG